MDTNDRSVSLVSKAKVKGLSERTPKQIQKATHIKQSIKWPFQAFGIKVNTKIPDTHQSPKTISNCMIIMERGVSGGKIFETLSINQQTRNRLKTVGSKLGLTLRDAWEGEVSGAALKWWDENMHSYAHNFHLALYYGISSCKLQGAMAKKVYNFHFLSSVRKEQNFIGITTHQLGGGHRHNNSNDLLFN